MLLNDVVCYNLGICMVFAVIFFCWVLDAETLHNSLLVAHLALEDCGLGRAIIADPVVAFIETPVPFFHRRRLVALCAFQEFVSILE